MLLAAGCKLAAGAHATDAGTTAPAIPVDLPKARSSDEVSTQFNVTIARDGSLFVNADALKNDGELTERARQAVASRAEVRAYIFADQSVAYRRVIEVMDALRTGGITEIAFGVAPTAPLPASRTPTPLGR